MRKKDPTAFVARLEDRARESRGRSKRQEHRICLREARGSSFAKRALDKLQAKLNGMSKKMGTQLSWHNLNLLSARIVTETRVTATVEAHLKRHALEVTARELSGVPRISSPRGTSPIFSASSTALWDGPRPKPRSALS